MMVVTLWIPLVSVYITMKNHHFISMAMFNSYVCLPEGNG